MTKQIAHRLKREVFERDCWVCVRCGSANELTVDHIVRRSDGGSDDLENLQTLCEECHRKKTRIENLDDGGALRVSCIQCRTPIHGVDRYRRHMRRVHRVGRREALGRREMRGGR